MSSLPARVETESNTFRERSQKQKARRSPPASAAVVLCTGCMRSPSFVALIAALNRRLHCRARAKKATGSCLARSRRNAATQHRIRPAHCTGSLDSDASASPPAVPFCIWQPGAFQGCAFHLALCVLPSPPSHLQHRILSRISVDDHFPTTSAAIVSDQPARGIAPIASAQPNHRQRASSPA